MFSTFETMVDQLSSYRKYVWCIRNLLLFAGLWPSRKWDGFIYRSISFVNAFMCFTMSCVVFNFCLHHLSNLDLLTKGFGIMGSYLSSVLKVCTLCLDYVNLEVEMKGKNISSVSVFGTEKYVLFENFYGRSTNSYYIKTTSI